MKEFGIDSCICGKIPRINKDLHETVFRYSIRCCDYVAKADTETKCIVVWNEVISKAREEQL